MMQETDIYKYENLNISFLFFFLSNHDLIFSKFSNFSTSQKRFYNDCAIRKHLDILDFPRTREKKSSKMIMLINDHHSNIPYALSFNFMSVA